MTMAGSDNFVTVLVPDGTDALTGTPHEISDSFEAHGWTDGLPVVLPTPSRVAAALANSPRDPDEVIGVVADLGVEVSVRTVAVNAVLAGCRAEDFPLVLALVDVMADPGFRIRDAGSTTSWEVLPIISGPDLEDRGINTGPGVTRVGRRANSTIGRFARLWIRNSAGIRIPPDWTDMAAIGQSTPLALAESETATRDLGWPTCRAEWGYTQSETVVGGIGVVGVSAPIYTFGSDPATHLDMIAAAIAGCSGHFGGMLHGNGWSPVLVLTPATAAVLAEAGLSKDDVRASIAAAATVPVRQLDGAFRALGHPAADFGALVAAGKLPPAYAASDDPSRLVPVIPDRTRLTIVVTGNPGRCQAKYYVPVGQPGRFGARTALSREPRRG